MLIRTEGNLFRHKHQAYAQGLSNEGVMGAGIALDFKARYPVMFQIYQTLCKKGKLKPGDSYLYVSDKKPHVFNLITQDSREKASGLYLKESVEKMYVDARKYEITDIAMPEIGCGLGKLNIDDLVVALQPFVNDSEHHVTVYEFKK